jgi:hypothetical protein
MKTKTKILNESQKKSILRNRNFLNNQNFILGQSEKNKVIIDYFLKNRLNNFKSDIEKLINWMNANKFFTIFAIFSLLLLIF